jgi:peptidylprolyl isomerase
MRGPLAVLDATRADSQAGAAGLRASAARHPHTSLRARARAEGDAVANDAGVPATEPIDWRFLAEHGARPRLRFTTSRGEFIVELDAEAAPLTALTLLRHTIAGRYDHLRFHRVEADFILQSGDFDGGHGAGGPDSPIRTEVTRIPFEHGTLGMASAGRDTEGSQYFITHGPAPSLDARYTAVGRVISGIDVADGMALGDLLVRVTVE